MIDNKRDILEFCPAFMDGWNNSPVPDIPDMLNFIRYSDGVQFCASIKDYGVLDVIHASVSPMKTINPNITLQYIVEISPDVLRTFFPNRDFAKQPDDPKRPDIKHFFSILRVDE